MSKRRLVAYEPLGDLLGYLPHRTRLQTVRNLYGLPTIQISYPDDGLNRSWLNNPVEIAVEKIAPGNTWDEYRNSRHLLSGTPDNAEVNYTNTIKQYNGIGIGIKLSAALITTPSPSDQPEGTPVEQMRHWINKTVGAILGDVIAENPGALAWLTKDFGFAADSDGQAWTANETLAYFEYPIKASLLDLLEEFTAQGLIEWFMNGRELRVFIARTFMFRDLTVGLAPVGFFWGSQAGITKVTEKIDYLATTTDGLLTGADGKVFDAHNFGSDGHDYYGEWKRPLDVPWAHNADQAKIGAEPMFRRGARERKEITIDLDWDASIIDADKDVKNGDRVYLQKGENPRTPADIDTSRNVGEQRILTIIEIDDDKPHGSITFADRLHRLEILTAQRAARLSSGSEVSTAGMSRRPQQSDPRKPSAPLTFTVTPSNYTDASGIQRAGFAAVWTDDGNAVPDPVTGQIDPLDRGGYELQFQSSETGADWQTYRIFKPTATSGTIKGLSATATGYMFRLRTISFTFIGKSDWFTTGAIAVPADKDVWIKAPGLVYDAGFENLDIQAKRTADSGSSGLTWPTVSGRTVAQIADTTAVLKSGTAGEPESGRVAVQGNEKYLVGVTGKRVGGTAATIQVGVRSWNQAGTATLVANVASLSATTSDQTFTAVYTMPSDSIKAEWRVRMTSPSGGAVIQVHTPIFDRQASTARVEDGAIVEVKHANDSVSTRTVVNDAITEPKHAALSASTRVINNLAVTNGKTADDAQDPRTIGADAIETVHLSSNLAVDGTVTTADGLTIGGLDASNIDFPGTGAIGDTGTGMFFTADVAAFSGSGTYDGTWTDPSARDSKVAVKPITVDQARALLDLAPITYKRREAWQREKHKRVIKDREIPEHWEKDPRRPGKKRRVPAKTIKGKVIPGRVDPRRRAGLFVEDVAAAGLEEVISRDAAGKPDGIDYGKLTPYLLRLIQDQNERIAVLEAASQSSTTRASRQSGRKSPSKSRAR